MKKIFSFLTVILFAGSMWAGDTAHVELCVSWNQALAYATDYTHDYTIDDLNGSTTTMTLGVKGVYRQGAANTYFQMNKKSGYFKNTTKLPGKITKIVTTWNAAKGATKCYFANDAQATSGDATTTVTAATSVTYTPDDEDDYYYFNIDVSTGSGSAQLTSCEVYYTTAAPAKPSITASNINFETVYVPNGSNYSHQYELKVTGKQLDDAISYLSSDNDKVAVSGTLTKDGGTLTVDVTAGHGAFAETITLSSGSVEKVVNVSGTVQEKYAAPISVAEAISAFSAGTLLVDDSLQVRGLVKSASAVYNSATIVITDVEDADKEFTLYSIKSLDKANFASIEDGVIIDVNDVKFILGDTVTAFGKVSTFGEPATPQIASGGYLIEVARDKSKIVPEIIPTPKSIALTSHEAVEGKIIALAYDNWEAEATTATATLFSDEECTQDITLGGWVSNFAFDADKSELTFDVSENTETTPRAAYILIAAENASEKAQVVVPISQVAAPTLDTYEPIALANIQSTDVVIVTMTVTANSNIYALSSKAATSSRPAAVDVTASKADGNLSVYSNAEVFWNIVYDSENGGYILYPNGETTRWLTGTSSGDPRINTGAGKYWTINKDYLYNPSAGKHIGVWTATPDWRTYVPQEGEVHSNISGQTLGFYVKSKGATGIFDTEVEGKTVKFMENGQIVIIKNGVRYNVLGAQL